MITSTSGSASSTPSASITAGTVVGPWTGVLMVSKRTCGHRPCATECTSRSAAEPRPVIKPTFLGR